MVPLPPLRDGARALPISSFRQSMPSFDTRCPGLHLQPGASVVLGCVGELPGSRCTDFNPRAPNLILIYQFFRAKTDLLFHMHP